MLTPEEKDVLRAARSIIRDGFFDYSMDAQHLGFDPKLVCQQLSGILHEKYNFENSEAEPLSAESDPVWRVETYVREDVLETTLNALAKDGYHLHRAVNIEPGLWCLIAFNPAKMATLQGQHLSNSLLGMFKDNPLAKMGL